MTINIYELHKRMTAHLFPAFSSTDEHFLALALCGEAGELANKIKKRWRDGADLSEEIRDEIADVRVYLELLAKCFDVEGDKLDERVQYKLQKVVEKHKMRMVDKSLSAFDAAGSQSLLKCESCGGTGGQNYQNLCTACNGSGIVEVFDAAGS